MFVAALESRLEYLRSRPDTRVDFVKEMRRFLPVATVRDTVEQASYWSYLTDLTTDLGRKAVAALPAPESGG